VEKSVEKAIGQKINRLKLAWLGTPVISYGDQPVTFRTRKALTLLIYLTTEAGIHTREKLTTLFWPESDTARGRGMLRTTLAHLREALDISYLKVEPQALGFAFECDFELDLRLIQTALNTIKSQPGLTERERVIHQLQRAVNLYRGDFLEGLSLADTPDFDDWVSLQREVWHGRLNLIFEALSQWQFEAGDLPASLETATRWKIHDPYGEAAPQRLMQLHFAGGNRTKALQVYEAYRKMLADEFGGKPTPEIEALAARIRASRPAQQPRDRAPQASAPAELSFVGRAGEFRRLVAAYQAASQGQSQVVIVMGEAGIGKSRLAGKFLHWATAQGAEVLAGRAFETGGELPYQPLAHLLRHRLEQEQAPAELLSVTWLTELSRLLPELHDRYPGLPQPQPDEATARGRLLEAITRLGQALAERAPLLLFIDDIQWADMPSLDALHYAMSRWTEHQVPVLVLLCARDIAFIEKSSVQQWFTGLKAKLAVTQLTLAPLTVEETLALVTSLEVGEDLSPTTDLSPPKFRAFAQTLFTETGGQPLYLVETIKALLEQKVLIPYYTADGVQRLQWQTLSGETTGHFPLPRLIPPSIRETIQDRLSRLTPIAMAMLTAAAVLGQAASFRQLAEMAGIDEMVGLDALEELVAKRLLLDPDQTGQAYLIAHDKFREVIYSETSAARRQVLHRRAVTALQGGEPDRLAYHALAAGMAEPAFHYSLAAGDAALRLFAAGEATVHYEAACKLVMAGQLPQVEVNQVRHLYTSLGRALELTSQFEQAGAVYKELETIAQQRAAPGLKLAALMAQITLGATLSQSFRPAEGTAQANGAPTTAYNPIPWQHLIEKTLTLAQKLGDQAAETKIWHNLSNLYAAMNKLPEAITAGEHALALAHQYNLREPLAFTLNDLGTRCYQPLCDFERAKAALHEAASLWRELGNLPMLADSLSGLCSVHVHTGSYEQAITFSEEAFQISQTIGNVWGQSYSRYKVGQAYWERGQPAQAIAVMAESIRLSQLAGFLSPQITTRAELAVVYGSLGALNQALEIAQEALTITIERSPLRQAYVMGILAQLYIWAGEPTEAEALLAQGKEDATQESHPHYALTIPLAEVELALSQGNYQKAVAESYTLLARLRQFDMQSQIPRVLYLQGQALLRLGQIELACERLAEAHTVAEAIGSQPMLWQILATLSRLEPDSAKANQLRQQAQELVKRIADNVGTPELRLSFLNLAEVREVLSE
jgi:DNA-binding SARP family transcriptional activator/tetratricopeptide (TPR) repeat protein